MSDYGTTPSQSLDHEVCWIATIVIVDHNLKSFKVK